MGRSECTVRKEKRFPSYDLVREQIHHLLKGDEPILIAIDGHCGSGKSTLADKIKEDYDCNIFHMDDYFLPIDMRTKSRLEEPGGNVHYERFKVEIIKPLQKSRDIYYRPYDCGVGSFSSCSIIPFKRLNIIEGSYSMHPSIASYYDLKIFLEIDSKEQIRRIKIRNGEDKIENFLKKWIPMENLYFSTYYIKDKSDIVINGNFSINI